MSAPPVFIMGTLVGDPADPSKFIAWDPSLLTNPDAAFRDNRGCPVGYAAIYVSDGFGGTATVCRRLDASVLGPGAAQTIAEETAPTGTDAAIIAIAEAAEQVAQGGAAVVNALAPGLSSMALLMIAAAVLLFVWKR